MAFVQNHFKNVIYYALDTTYVVKIIRPDFKKE